MFSYRPPQMAEQMQGDQLEPTYSSSVRIRDVALKTYQKQWTIGRSGKRGSGISLLVARKDDDDDQSFGDCPKCTNRNWYHPHIHVPLFFSLSNSRYLSLFSLSFIFTFHGIVKSIILRVFHFFFFFGLSLSLVVWLRLGDLFVSRNSSEICASWYPGQILGCTYTICS